MNSIDLAKQLNEETEKLVIYQQRYDSARRTLLGWMENDIERSEGSGAQEARRESHYESLCEEERSAEAALNYQKAIVKRLAGQLDAK